MKNMQIGAVTIGTEEPSGQNFCRCTAGRETGGDEQGRKDSGVDQREADQSRNQEAKATLNLAKKLMIGSSHLSQLTDVISC